MKNILLRLFIYLVIFCSGGYVTAQSISGLVSNTNNIPIQDVEVIATIENKQKFSTITNEHGEFKIQLPQKGKYLLEVIQNNERLISESIDINEDVKRKYQVETVQNIEGVIIRSEKKLIERKIDRLVFNVEKSVSAAGGDVLDALKVIPGVQIKNDEISIIGKSGVSVMIDDRIVQLNGNELSNYLKSISSDDIKSIEVITTPPAKYDAQGNSGLINIRYKNGKNNTWNTTIRSSYIQKTYALGSVGGNFMIKKDKLSLSTNINYLTGSQRNIDQNTMNFPNETWVGYQPRKIHYDPSFSFRAGADYDFSDKFSMGVIFLTQTNNMKIDNSNNLITVFNKWGSNKKYDIVTNALSNSKSPSNSLNFHSIYKIDTLGTKLSLDVDYFNYKEKSDYAFTSVNLYNDNEDISTKQSGANYGNLNLNNTSLKTDLELPLKGIKLSMGAKFSFSDTGNDLRWYNLNVDETEQGYQQTNNFKYKENTQAGYISAEKSVEKWTFQLGLRLENTQIKGNNAIANENFNRNYTKLFPTAYIMYAINKDNNISANYSRRINRPSFESLNPFRIVSNQYTYVEGNPFLQPSYTDNFELNYSYKNWISKIYFSRLSNGFQQLPSIDPVTNIQIIRPENYFETNTWGLNESYTFNPLSWIETVATGDLFYSDSKSLVSFTNPSRNGWNSNLSIYNAISINKSKTLQIALSYDYSFAGVQDIYKTTSRSNLNVGVVCNLLSNKLRIVLVGDDLLSGQRSTYTAYSNDIKVSFRNYYDTRNVRLSISYKFGNSKISVQQKNFGNEEEKARASN
ncbi:TonB-dependent receptor [Chryseobacterium paridis]|uniref:TonB-dependent receptor n=1 Tax=Chryseobacterium paridis TaxID=2800328 RepID=A0ABS1FYR1_9FLAO|nr:TonB-dependent receptor [Chryseobacterium paridis]MBK1897530.1 TonB-dependent receptor [Chryseobacterium paridis]